MCMSYYTLIVSDMNNSSFWVADQCIITHTLQDNDEDKPLEIQNGDVQCRQMFTDLIVPVQAFSQTSRRSNDLLIVIMLAELSDAVQFCTSRTAR